MLAHDQGHGHPESPARLQAIVERLRARPVAGTRWQAPRPATREEVRRVHAVLAEMGKARGVSVATMALAWILRHPSRPWPITGTVRPQALQEAVAALDVALSAEDWYRVWEASIGHPVP